MAKKEKKTEAESSSAPSAKSSNKLPMLVAIANTVVAVGAMGFLVYTKVLFERPPITEEGERARLTKLHASPAPTTTPGFIVIEPTTINISPNPAQPEPADGTSQQIRGKIHYATIGLSIEIRDIARKDEVEALRPIIMDKFLALVGRKSFRELTAVQGRYLLRTQIVDIINLLLARQDGKQKKEDESLVRDILVTNVFFTHFIVQ